jgi:hypothetical protein
LLLDPIFKDVSEDYSGLVPSHLLKDQKAEVNEMSARGKRGNQLNN